MVDIGLDKVFSRRGGQRKVAEYLLKHGIAIESDGTLLVGKLEVTHISVAKAVCVDRRVVKSAVESVTADEGLKRVFKNLSVTPSLRELAPVLGFGAIEVIPDDAKGKGIVAGVTAVIFEEGIGIRQVIADDPMFDNAELMIVTEKPIPRTLIDRILQINGVHKVVVLA